MEWILIRRIYRCFNIGFLLGIWIENIKWGSWLLISGEEFDESD